VVITTSLTKKKVADHFYYNSWKYILLIVLSIMGWNIIYTQTAYRVPADKRIDVYVKTGTTTAEVIDAFLEPIWKDTVPDMEIVSSTILLASNDYSSSMQLTTWIMAGEGDIYILPSSDYKTYASSGVFLDLQPYIDDGSIQVSDLNLDAAKIQVGIGMDDNGNTVYDEELRPFGIPMDNLYGYMEGMSLDNRGMVMAITVANGNTDNVVPFLNALIEAGRGDKPAWLLETEIESE